MAHQESNVSETQHFTYIWTIENVTEAILQLLSPTFTVKEMAMTKWCISITTAISKSIMLNIRRAKKDDGPKSIKMKFEISFLGIDGKPLTEKVQEGKFKNDTFIGFDDFADRREVFVRRRAEFLPKEALTVRCRMWRTGTEISQIDSCFARTLLRPDRHTFVWAIREFSTLPRNEMRKILLKRGQSNELAFSLFLTENDGVEYVSINLECSVKEWRTLKICLLDFEGKVVHPAEYVGYFEENFKFEYFIGKRRLILDKVSLLPNDVMSLRCEIERNPKLVWSTIENYKYFNSKSYRVVFSDEAEILHLDQEESFNVTSSFIEAMKSLIEEGTLSDVILTARSKSFPAHKCILSARSPVFKDMFGGDMKEETSRCIEIPDVDEDTLRQLLSYIYTDKVGDLEWRLAIDLYRAADKYCLLDLKRRCATILKSDLSAGSVCAILSAADVHQNTELREAAQDFVMHQGEGFFTTYTWQNFKMENSSLAVDILEGLLCSMKRQN